MRVTVQTRGLDELREFFTSRAVNLARGPRTVRVFAAGARNQVIAEAQAAQDRNPFFLTPAEARAAAQLTADALSAALSDGGSLARHLPAVGDYIVDAYKRHIALRKSGGVSPVGRPVGGHQTRPLSARYAEQKKRKHGKVLPELIATGEFYQSIDFEVV